MVRFIVLAAAVGLFSLYQYHTADAVPPSMDSGAGHTQALLGALLVLLPILALFATLRRAFSGWRRFHGRMRRDGLWRRP